MYSYKSKESRVGEAQATDQGVKHEFRETVRPEIMCAMRKVMCEGKRKGLEQKNNLI